MVEWQIEHVNALEKALKAPLQRLNKTLKQTQVNDRDVVMED
jgi:hypothetical protein